MNLMKEVLSISIWLPFLSNICSMKWKKLDFRKLDGGCFVNSMRPTEQLKIKKTNRVRIGIVILLHFDF